MTSSSSAAAGPTPPLRWALVGTSEFATEWIGAAIVASPGSRLVAVVSASLERARAAAERLGAEVATDDLADLDASMVDVVHLVTPNQLHAAQTILALERGLHVVVEKPMALDMAEAQRMADAAAAARRQLFVAHCMAWAPPVEAAARLVADGRIGVPVDIRITAGFDYPPAGLWRQERTAEAGGGAWMDLGPHAVDAAMRILGPVVDVSAVSSHLVHTYAADDVTSVLLRFASGATGSILTTFVAGHNELVIEGTAGRVRSAEWLGRELAGDLRLERGGADLIHFDGQTVAGSEPIALERTNVYHHQVADVERAIGAGQPSRIDLANGLRVQAVVDAAIRSAREGRTVVVERT